MKKFLAPFAAALAFAVAASAATSGAPASRLDKPVSYFAQDKQPIQTVLKQLSSAHKITIIADPDVTGEVDVEIYDTTVRGALDAICYPYGFEWQQMEQGWISVRRAETEIFHIEYPNLERSGTSEANINLGSSNMNSGGSGNGLFGGGAVQRTSGANGGGAASMDTGTVTVKQKNDALFWENTEKQIASQVGKEGQFHFIRLAGTVQVTANQRIRKRVRDFIADLNQRIGGQVLIIGKVVEVELTDENKTGVDWRVAAFRVGQWLRVGSSEVNPTTNTRMQDWVGTTSNIVAPGGFAFSPDTVSGTIGVGKVDLMIRALQEQGNVNVKSVPKVWTTNNQTAFIKDAQDKPFFRLDRQTNLYQTQSLSGGLQPITQNEYTLQTVSIGTILAVTPQVSENGDITIDVTPAITRLKGVVLSPDGQQSAPDLQVKQASTIVRVRSGETAIIGGLITESESETSRRVPVLGDIPVMGRLFRSNGKAVTRSELVIFLTPLLMKPGSVDVFNDSRITMAATAGDVKAVPATDTPRPQATETSAHRVESVPLAP